MFGLISKKKAELEQQKLRNEISEKDFELQKLQNAINEAEEKNANAVSENESLKKTVEELEKKNSELFSNPERIENVLKDSKVEELTGQKDKLLSELTDVKKQLKDTEANYDDEQKKLEQKNTEFTELQERFNSVEKENQANKEEFEKSTKKLADEIKELEDEVEDLEDDLKDTKKDLDQKKEEFNKLQEKFNSVEKENQTNKEELEKSEKELNKLNADYNSLKEEFEKSTKKLADEIEELEDEVEDLEDDLKDTKKDLDQKKEEFNKLQERFNSVEKENQANKENLKDANETIKEQGKKLSVKDGSLGFVREILKAKEVNSGNIQDIYSKIDSAADYISEDFKDCVYASFNKDENDEYFFGWGLYHWEMISKKTWIKNKTTIAFVGEFSAGKTSIVNKILAQGGSSITLPVSTKATTAIPTYISGSDSVGKTGCKFFTPDNKTKVLTEKTFNEVNKETLHEVDGISNLIKYFIMTINNKNLRNFSILDTPGFSSNDKEDAQRTIDVINECDALFWVFDVNNGNVNNTSLKIIKEYLIKPLFVVINKTDTKAPSEVAKVEDLIRATFNREGIKVEKYIKFSQKESPTIILDELKKIPRSNDTSQYIEDLEYYATSLLKVLENNVSDLAVQNSKNKDEIDNCVEVINSHLYKVEEICGNLNDTIVDSYKEHIFKSDKYELSIQQFKQIKNDLSKLIPYNENDNPIVMNALIKSIDDYATAITRYNDSCDAYYEAKAKRDRFEECVKRLKEKLNAVK